jgi:hypothetical protein
MHPLEGWTGHTACALQAALRMSHEAFAAHLGVGLRTVAAWHQKPALRPKSEMQQLLDTALDQAPQPARDRFARLVGQPSDEPPEPVEATEAEHRLANDPNVAAALEWLDRHAGWPPGRARQRVASMREQIDIRHIRDRGDLRGRVTQRQIAESLRRYYSDSTEGHGLYSARFGDAAAITSILSSAPWLDLACPLMAPSDALDVTGESLDIELDAEAAEHAVRRLAEALAVGVRFVDMPLYRLAQADVRQGRIAGSLGLSRFVEYVLTMDLLEGELVDAIARGSAMEPASMPLRNRYLPDIPAVLDFPSRLCAGGALALCAIARPATRFGRGPDYVLLVQERSGHVINAARRLAVIPKGFHQPQASIGGDIQLGMTLLREMEEELFGRDDIDNTLTDQRCADPMHPTRLSQPMCWLLESPDRLRMECTGFGLNLVSGNYEFASLVVIEDDEFWVRFGGEIQANWEASSLRHYSTLDSLLLSALARDDAWSNEGLFALLQGLRRLRDIGGSRVDLPPIEWSLQ